MVVLTTIGKISKMDLMRKSYPWNCKNILKLFLLTLVICCLWTFTWLP
jgi:hypothetical protein